ncbi:unnamed protein product [Brassica rapa]|uniref:Uncharacterized protein n=1 Tax=Brassica campestris TaxID=3711 RepID=A0A8D9LWA3_BRACM|nr:unnamed protein product [Brassica rapa]
MKPNVEPSLLHISTHKRIRVYPHFLLAARTHQRNHYDDYHEERQQNRAKPSRNGGSSTTPSRCHNRRSN